MFYAFKSFKLALYALLTTSPVAAREIRPRVVGGVPDDGHEFPFAVMLQLAVSPFLRSCTGSLLAPTWVLTAAHCCPRAGNEKLLRVKYGDRTIPTNETRFLANVIKANILPCSRNMRGTSRRKCDVGLLKTERISNTPFAKLSAVDYEALLGLPVKYGGFGQSKLYPKGHGLTVLTDLDPPFYMGEGVLMSCKRDGGMTDLTPNICLAPRCGPRQQPYFGDSGSPMIYNGRIIGVCSNIKDLKLPIVGYAPVSPYLDWINKMVHSD